MGFVYSEYLTSEMRRKALEDKLRTDFVKGMEEGKVYNVGQHLWANMLHGCFASGKGLECGKEGTSSASLSALPENYKPLALTDSMDEQWLNLIKDLSLQ
eukprot:scaffold11494_cov111-Alexandrium_tamarense.AAC.1